MKKTIDIIYEDRWLVAIDKPSGLMSVSGGKTGTETAYSLVNDYITHKYNGRKKAHVLHRLDRDTSGVLVFAKDWQTKMAMTDNWNGNIRERRYVAVLDGVPEPEKGHIESWLTENDKNFMVYSSLKDNGGELAVTDYEVLKAEGTDQDGRGTDDRKESAERKPAELKPAGTGRGPALRHSLVAFNLSTGRKNQIRVHAAAHLHCPVAGDSKYGNGKSAKRLCLHAKAMSFIHPVTRRLVRITSNTPRFFNSLV